MDAKRANSLLERKFDLEARAVESHDLNRVHGQIST